MCGTSVKEQIKSIFRFNTKKNMSRMFLRFFFGLTLLTLVFSGNDPSEFCQIDSLEESITEYWDVYDALLNDPFSNGWYAIKSEKL